MKSYPHFINKKLSYEQQVKQGLDFPFFIEKAGKSNPCLAYFFHSPSCEKNIYKVLTKNTGGYDAVRKINKKIQNAKTN